MLTRPLAGVLTAAALAGALTACGGSGPFGLPQACTAIGSAEGVDVDFTTALPFEGGDYFAEVSVPSTSASRTTGFAGNDEYGLSGSVPADLSGEPTRVDVRVTTERGEVAYEASTTTTPQLFQPNGAGCDGANYRISLRATRDGQLLPRDPDEVTTDDLGRISIAVPTGCGISEATDGYSSYERVGGVLSDGAGHAPAGWNTPYQRGWAAIDGDTLTFSDERGHRETFRRVPDGQAPAPCG